MISILGAASAASAVGAAGLGGHWLRHQRDTMGRPRAFPVWSISVLAILAVAAAVPGVRRRSQERTLSFVASTLVGHHVSVHCQSFGRALADVGAELGYVRFREDGPEPSTLIKRDPCTQLRRYAGGHRTHPSQDAAVAIHVLTHEAMHMRGLLNEAKAECAAMQRDAQTAALLGATPAAARQVARIYWLTVYPQMPADYRDGECAAGGPDDEHLSTAPWVTTS